MHLLINILDADPKYFGYLISKHRTLEAAESAQRIHRGAASHIPTTIVEPSSPWHGVKGTWVRREHC